MSSCNAARWTRRALFTAVALGSAFAAAPDATAQPVRYFAEEQPATAGVVTPSGPAESSRNRFLANFGAISTESFESFASQPNFPSSGAGDLVLALTFTGSAGNITATATANTGAIVDNPDTNNPQNGIYATDGNQYLFARGTVEFEFGSTPVSAFGFYINDVETVKEVILTLTPAGGGTPETIAYGPIDNTGSTAGVPGDGQLSFVGFIDTRTTYETVTVSFPGAANEGFGFDQLTVGDVNQVITTQVTIAAGDITNGPGWRLLSTPVQGVTPGRLSFLNLVQGVPAGNGNSQQQYPDAGSNFYTAYNGGGRFDYVPAAATGQVLAPGRGFWWYWYDVDIDPDDDAQGGGTSESVELTGFELTALGQAITSNVDHTFDDNDDPAGTTPGGDPLETDDDFYMIGNPYALPFDVASISTNDGVLSDNFFAWNPGNPSGTPPENADPAPDGPGSYEILTATSNDHASEWQGLMSETTGVTGTVTYTFDVGGRDNTQTPPFYGRRVAEGRIEFELNGTTTSGAPVRDAAAWIRVRDDAEAGWDRYDASKPMPPSAHYALVAPMGERDGEPYPQAVFSLPTGDAAAIPLGMTANEAGTFTLTWTGSLVEAGGARLTDLVTGETVDLTADGAYTFEADATDWATRFEVQANASAVSAEDDPSVSFVGTPFPNPTASGAQLNVRLAEAGAVTVSVFDALGRLVERSEVTSLAPGVVHSLSLPTSHLAPGVYAVRVDGPALGTTRALTVVR